MSQSNLLRFVFLEWLYFVQCVPASKFQSLVLVHLWPGLCFDIKTIFPCVRFPIIMTRLSCDHHTFMMGIPILLRKCLHIEMVAWGPFYEHGLTLIPAWISNYIHYKVRDEITYPFLNFNGATVEVLEWIRNLIPQFTGPVITYPCWVKVNPC